MSNLYIFLSGALMFGFLIAGAFFLKFWHQSRDGLFLKFALAFGILSLERVLLLFLSERQDESNFVVFLFRLTAFAVIISAIVDKNRKDQA